MTYSGLVPCLRQVRSSQVRTGQGEVHYVPSPTPNPESPHRRFATTAGDDEAFCGCCGNATEGDPLWCDRCTLHIADTGSLWDRTYFARYGLPCPFQIGGGI